MLKSKLVILLVFFATCIYVCGCMNYPFGYNKSNIKPFTYDNYVRFLKGDVKWKKCTIGYAWFEGKYGPGGLSDYKAISLVCPTYQKQTKSISPEVVFTSVGHTLPQENKEHSFSEVNVIFNYLDKYNDYFFNGDEFKGIRLQDSGGVSPIFLKMKSHMIALQVNVPDDKPVVWLISKSADEPDPILQGLIDILEENFISQFE